MKKSELFKMAQIAVLNSNFCNIDKLAILRELMAKEDIALFTEKTEGEAE